jgi:glyoxylase-like metal-dependent hydrolase (beta-lactamase superfamily II)
MAFLTEDEPTRHVALPVLPGIRRVVARNPGPMTYHGTNTYLIDRPEGCIVLDPGPENHPEHIEDLLRATDGKISAILLSHSHHDHYGALEPLRAATGAPTYGFTDSANPAVSTEHRLTEGECFAGLMAIHTPGHAADHLCFAMEGGILFSADHVMSWSTTVISPPGGDMSAYFRSLNRLLARDDEIYLSGHGPILHDPRPYVRALLGHRQMREAAIATALQDGPVRTPDMTARLYRQLDPTLQRAAERNVLAHLLKLETEGRAQREGEIWRAL